jgi:hypothetical protein
MHTSDDCTLWGTRPEATTWRPIVDRRRPKMQSMLVMTIAGKAKTLHHFFIGAVAQPPKTTTTSLHRFAANKKASDRWLHFSSGNGGRTRARTWDPLIKSQLLYQLSYAPPMVRGTAGSGAGYTKAAIPCR